MPVKKTQSVEKEKPKVSASNNEVRQTRWQRKHDSGGVIWGVLVAIAGIILLLNTFEIVPWDIWQNIWRFWPVLLILGGIHLALGNNPFASSLIFFLSIALFGLVALFALREVNPNLVRDLPPEINNILNWMKDTIQL